MAAGILKNDAYQMKIGYGGGGGGGGGGCLRSLITNMILFSEDGGG